jgi:hypothetical protein
MQQGPCCKEILINTTDFRVFVAEIAFYLAETTRTVA